jgi:enoyl-CoA hydratase/carnithine racemase
VERFGAPPSIGAVLDDAELLSPRSRRKKSKKHRNGAGAAIREVGSTRRVFLSNPYLTPNELGGLAYRIKVLTKNTSLSSILIAATDDRIQDDNSDVESLFVPSILLDRDENFMKDEYVDPGFSPSPGQTYLVSGGYDPTSVNRTNSARVEELLTNVSELAVSVRGSAEHTMIPTIFMSHGMVLNAGYAFLHSSYVLATRETSFQITTPRMGLSFDPVGLSFALPRLGREFSQPSKKYPVGMLLAMTGYQASAEDCMETGLCTHYIETPLVLGDLENTLAQLPPYQQQTIVKSPIRFQGQSVVAWSGSSVDPNRSFRNVSVADTIQCYSDYCASGAEMWVNEDVELEDPSLEVDDIVWHEDRASDLVDYAATFADILHEPTVAGIYDRLQQAAAKTDVASHDERLTTEVAQEFCRRMQAASPLALSVTHRLLQLGSRQSESWKSCMDREHRVQAKLMIGEDFGNWQATHGTGKETKWKHSSLHDVTPDEVTELIEA